MTTRWDKYDHDELADILSDYHKDVHGYRLQMYLHSRERLIEELVSLDNYMENMKSTKEGRERLREDGWDIEEPVLGSRWG